MVRRVSSGSAFEKRIGYSRAVVDRDMVYVSGTTGYDYATLAMPEAVGEQARNALATIERALNEAGADIKDVLRVVYYLTDVSYYDEVIDVVSPIFTDIRPAATMVVCALTKPEMKVEIEVTARIGAHQS
jgi:enamine deaminase RidA (YjgF/YER057c/UK114 family)